ncbi:Histidine kinase-, DNA gyrase B-, and HSP90-like ATPase [Natronoarchaeum philippinense]|uniref:histidine kinase n=1 Tax=Natronoarchaeum philippinense TaxID=558529 RepID=A0A285NC35_NATPI|nr:HAMP domain-containing sensor histidine kinase [Natronoarchaeum philippinense]SNZ06979.1 Histidine kinase-, DNA gyrase B-, and HSP90-like ATPase [Natronoarchaeum philippinense]
MGDTLAQVDAEENESLEDEELLEEVAQVLSHDLSNLLTTAQSSLELARRQHDDEHIERTAAVLDNSQQLTEDIVTLARTGRRFDDVSRTDLASVAERAWLSIDEPAVSLLIEESIEFEADTGGLRLLFENLFQNAIDHGPAEELIRVGVIERDGEGGFFVADDGEGFEIDDPKRAFESGHSTDENRSGLGLAITRRVADAHCWTITVGDSQEGGARFEFTGVDCLE